MDAAMTLTAAPRIGPMASAAAAPTDPVAVPRPVMADGTPPRPSSLEQSGRVTQAKLSDTALPGARAVSEPERALKPYGVAMLPDRPVGTGADAPPAGDTATPAPSLEPVQMRGETDPDAPAKAPPDGQVDPTDA